MTDALRNTLVFAGQKFDYMDTKGWTQDNNDYELRGICKGNHMDGGLFLLILQY